MAQKRSAAKVPVLGVNGNGNNSHTQNDDKSIYVFQRDKISRPLNIHELPWTIKQKEFIALAQDKKTKILLVRGPAGTSKTLVAVYCMLQLLNEHKLSDIVLMRSAVESADSKLGYLPGTVDEKMADYLLPYTDKLEELLSAGDIKYLLDDKRINAIPLGFARGRHLAVKGVIVDESQNITYNELITIMTRMGEFSKTFILCDPDQSDLPMAKQGGFQKLWHTFDDDQSREEGIRTFEFFEEDIVRSRLVKYIVTKINSLKKQDRSMFPELSDSLNKELPFRNDRGRP